MTADRPWREPSSLKGPVEIIQVPGGEAIQTNRSQGRLDALVDRPSVLSDRVFRAVGFDALDPLIEEFAYAVRVGPRLLTIDVRCQLG